MYTVVRLAQHPLRTALRSNHRLVTGQSGRLLLGQHARHVSLSRVLWDKQPLKVSSQVEKTVQELKTQQQEENEKSTLAASPPPLTTQVVKKALTQRIWDEVVHYYHGFRLLGIDVKISSGLVWRVLKGKSLSRREYRLLTRTVGDLFRLLPFSVFIIVPFMEVLLPVFIKFFPGMLPSTFQSTSDKEDKLKQSLKVRLEMTKFLQGTLDNMAVQHSDRYSSKAKEFSEWFSKVRNAGETIGNEEILKYSQLFEDEITLDSLTRSQLIALCRTLEVQTLGTNNFLRFQLRMKLRSLAADDKMIEKEGVESLTLGEVQQACRARGMRAYGISEIRLRNQLNQWLDLSLNKKVPPSLLLLSSALMLPETIPTTDKLKATISSLPETIITQTQAAIGEKEGKIDHKVRIEVLKAEEKKIKEERQEQREEKAKLEKELLIDKAPVISTTPILEEISSKISIAKLEQVENKKEELKKTDFEIIENAIDSVSKDKKFIVEKEEVQALKAEMEDYKEDVEDLAKVTAEQIKPEIRESKAAKRLFKSLNKMITKLDSVMVDLEKKEKQIKESLSEDSAQKKAELLKIDDIIGAIRQIKEVPDQNRLDYITKVLVKMDDDRDGSLKIEDVLKVVEIIGKEDVKMSDKQIDELIELMDKEEILEVEDKIEKALQTNQDVQKLTQEKEKLKEEVKAKASAKNNTPKTNNNTPPVAGEDATNKAPPPVSSIDKTTSSKTL